MKQGDIFLVEIPDAHGYEQSGLRPSIIFGEPVANTVLIIPCTSNLESLRFLYTFLISPSKLNKLKTETVALIFQLRAIDKKRLVKRTGCLNNSNIADIKKLVRKILFL